MHPSLGQRYCPGPGASLRLFPSNEDNCWEKQGRAAPAPVTGQTGHRRSQSRVLCTSVSPSALCGLEGHAPGARGPQGCEAQGMGPSPGRRPQLPRNLLHLLEEGSEAHGKGLPSHTLSAENCGHPSPTGSLGLAGSRGSPFQQLQSLPHSHPSLRLVEFMKSPWCHKSCWELLSVLYSRQLAVGQGFPCPYTTGGPRGCARGSLKPSLRLL